MFSLNCINAACSYRVVPNVLSASLSIASRGHLRLSTRRNRFLVQLTLFYISINERNLEASRSFLASFPFCNFIELFTSFWTNVRTLVQHVSWQQVGGVIKRRERKLRRSAKVARADRYASVRAQTPTRTVPTPHLPSHQITKSRRIFSLSFQQS